jgi:hypothetical protein
MPFDATRPAVGTPPRAGCRSKTYKWKQGELLSDVARKQMTGHPLSLTGYGKCTLAMQPLRVREWQAERGMVYARDEAPAPSSATHMSANVTRENVPCRLVRRRIVPHFACSLVPKHYECTVQFAGAISRTKRPKQGTVVGSEARIAQVILHPIVAFSGKQRGVLMCRKRATRRFGGVVEAACVQLPIIYGRP